MGHSKGAQHAVPCPHCQKPLDFTDASELLERGSVFQCDHCDRKVKIENVVDTKMVWLSPVAR